MAVLDETEAAFRLCAPVSKAKHEDPIGTATPADAFLIVEQPLPWTRKVEGSRGFPRAVLEAVDHERERGRRVRLLAIAPDRALTRPGLTRILCFRRPPAPFAAFAREEYLVPAGEVAPLAQALLAGPPRPALFAPFCQPEEGVRDILVCTHGSRDACCATFGFPTFVALRHLANQRPAAKLRVWRASHLGGHRFAPTLLDLPEGRMWGHLEPPQLAALADREGDVAALRHRYRGWTALDGPLPQAAERELFVRHGWEWTTRQVAVHSPGGLAAGGPAEVRFDTLAPDGTTEAYAATVEAAPRVQTLSSSGKGALEDVPQYRVSRLGGLPPGGPVDLPPEGATASEAQGSLSSAMTTAASA